MPSPTDVARRRGYLLAFLVRQAEAGIRELIEDLIFAAARDKGAASLPATVHDDLVYLQAHKLVSHAAMPDEVTGERQVYWRATLAGKNLINGHAESPAGIEL